MEVRISVKKLCEAVMKLDDQVNLCNLMPKEKEKFQNCQYSILIMAFHKLKLHTWFLSSLFCVMYCHLFQVAFYSYALLGMVLFSKVIKYGDESKVNQ